MDTIYQYIIQLSQAEVLLALILVVGIFVALICMAVINRNIALSIKKIDAVMKHFEIELPEEEPVKKEKTSKKEKS